MTIPKRKEKKKFCNLTESRFEIDGYDNPLMASGFGTEHGKNGSILARLYIIVIVNNNSQIKIII